MSSRKSHIKIEKKDSGQDTGLVVDNLFPKQFDWEHVSSKTTKRVTLESDICCASKALKTEAESICSDSDDEAYYDPTEHIDLMLTQLENAYECFESAYEMGMSIRSNFAKAMKSGSMNEWGKPSGTFVETGSEMLFVPDSK